MTRDHSVAERALPSGTPVLCLIGGKWTTFRAFAQQITDDILGRLERARRLGTQEMAIGGGKEFPTPDERDGWIADCTNETGLPAARVEMLLDRYGTRARLMAAELGADTPLSSLPRFSRQELVWLIDNERVGSLEDLIRRRTDIAISGDLTAEVEREVASLFEGHRAVAS